MDNHLLFQAAQEIGLKRGDVWRDSSELSEQMSMMDTNGNYLLRDAKGSIVTKINQLEIEETLFRSGKIDPSKLSTKATHEIASSWASSRGYSIPSKMGGCLSTFLVVVGLCAYVIPGILILLFVWYNGNQYERDMKALVAKWIDAGYPKPGEKEKPVQQLQRVEQKAPEPISTETRLEELRSMKEKGLISQEEYETLRKKALGL